LFAWGSPSHCFLRRACAFQDTSHRVGCLMSASLATGQHALCQRHGQHIVARGVQSIGWFFSSIFPAVPHSRRNAAETVVTFSHVYLGEFHNSGAWSKGLGSDFTCVSVPMYANDDRNLRLSFDIDDYFLSLKASCFSLNRIFFFRLFTPFGM